jgi:hypothetical protein
MRKLGFFAAIIIFSLLFFARVAAPPPVDQPALAQSRGAANATQTEPAAELPPTPSPLPLYGILAVGFLCASYMTLRTN